MRTLDELMDTGQSVRITYDDGRMEFMPPISDEHEERKTVVARLIELYALERNIPITGRGSMTMIQPEREKGAEPDECYYVQTPRPPATGHALDTTKAPPPDLVIEVDISRGSVAREPIYAAMGIVEI